MFIGLNIKTSKVQRYRHCTCLTVRLLVNHKPETLHTLEVLQDQDAKKTQIQEYHKITGFQQKFMIYFGEALSYLVCQR